MVFLTSCADISNLPGPHIKNIIADPEQISEGSLVTYTITYENTHPTDTFYDVTMLAKLPDYFELVPSNSPVQISKKDGEMFVTWNIGTLKPTDSGDLTVEFNVNTQIPSKIYQIEIFGNIQGNSFSNTPVANYGHVTQYIQGRLTPTAISTQTFTPIPETVIPSDIPTWTPIPTSTITITPTPVSEGVSTEITAAFIGLIGVIIGGAITAYASIQAAKIQASKKRKYLN